VTAEKEGYDAVSEKTEAMGGPAGPTIRIILKKVE